MKQGEEYSFFGTSWQALVIVAAVVLLFAVAIFGPRSPKLKFIAECVDKNGVIAETEPKKDTPAVTYCVIADEIVSKYEPPKKEEEKPSDTRTVE